MLILCSNQCAEQHACLHSTEHCTTLLNYISCHSVYCGRRCLVPDYSVVLSSDYILSLTLLLGFRVPKVVMYVSISILCKLANFRNGFPQLDHPEGVI